MGRTRSSPSLRPPPPAGRAAAATALPPPGCRGRRGRWPRRRRYCSAMRSRATGSAPRANFAETISLLASSPDTAAPTTSVRSAADGSSGGGDPRLRLVVRTPVLWHPERQPARGGHTAVQPASGLLPPGRIVAAAAAGGRAARAADGGRAARAAAADAAGRALAQAVLPARHAGGRGCDCASEPNE